MRYYHKPKLVYSIFSRENIITASESKTNLNAWLRSEGVEDSAHVVLDMKE